MHIIAHQYHTIDNNIMNATIECDQGCAEGDKYAAKSVHVRMKSQAKKAHQNKTTTERSIVLHIQIRADFHYIFGIAINM